MNQVDNINLKTKGGTDAAYLTARIARDRPDILQKMKAGEYKSVRAAAIDAGIVRKQSELNKGKRAVQKMTADELAMFRAWLKHYKR